MCLRRRYGRSAYGRAPCGAATPPLSRCAASSKAPAGTTCRHCHRAGHSCASWTSKCGEHSYRSVQNKSLRFRGSRSIFALKNMLKNVVFWGVRKFVRIIIWSNNNSEFLVILTTQKFHSVGWVNPVWGYIIFITSNRNYHKKCDSFCTFGNSLHGFFSRILGGLGGSHGSSTLYWTDRIVFSACFTSSEIYFVHFSVCFFLRSIFGLDFSPFF